MPGKRKPYRPAASSAHCSARKALVAPSVAEDLSLDALPPVASIVIVRRTPSWLDGDGLVFYVENQTNVCRCADTLVTDDALNVVAETKEELGHSRSNIHHCPSGSGDGDGQNYLEMVGNTYLAPPISSSGDWPRVVRLSRIYSLVKE